jgi:hypothetical protein
MHTKDFLAQELEKCGLKQMAAKARAGYYHDYLSPLDMPETQLMLDLHNANHGPAVAALIQRHLNGEFDASLEESEEWANSPEGKAAMGMLSPGMAAMMQGKGKP